MSASTFRAAQVQVSGPLTTAHRTTEGVREAAQTAAEYLEVDPASLSLVDVTLCGTQAKPQIVYTFTTRPRS